MFFIIMIFLMLVVVIGVTSSLFVEVEKVEKVVKPATVSAVSQSLGLPGYEDMEWKDVVQSAQGY